MPPSLHRIRWKGRTDGPFSREEIRTRLADGELSLLHRIEVDGKWVSLGDFLSGAAESARAARPGKPAQFTPKGKPGGERPVDSLAKAGFFLCGLCFVLPGLATVGALLVARRMDSRGEHAVARTQATLAALLSLMGLAFWAALVVARAKGLI